MDDDYPTLKRPRKKLTFPTDKANDQWSKDVNTLEDVDKIFDDLDFSFHEFHIAKTPRPISTSSPINAIALQQETQERDNSASPILFDCEEEKQHLGTAETQTEKNLLQNSKRDEIPNSDSEAVPKKAALDVISKPLSPSDSPVRRKIQTAAAPAPEKLPEPVHVSKKVKHDMTSFLEKLQNAGQPKPAITQTSQAKVMPPLPEPEPEDEFFILEEDVSLFVSIPNKPFKSTKERRTKASYSEGPVEKERSADNLKDIEQDQRLQENEAEQTNKKTKNHSTRLNSTASNEDCPALTVTESDNVENQLQNNKYKNKKVKLVPSKDDKYEEDIGTETDKEMPSRKIVKRGRPVKNASKSSKSDQKHSQRTKKSGKDNRKDVRTVEAVAEEVEAQSQEVNCEDQLNDDAPVSEENNVKPASLNDPADVDLRNSKEEEMSDEAIVVGKRKRRPPGDWWINSPTSSEREAKHQQQTVTKTKPHNKESNSAPSPAPAATAGEKKKHKHSSSSSDSQRQNTEKTKSKKGKLKRTSPVKSALSDKPEEDLGRIVQDRGLDHDSDSDSSPLLFPHRDRSISSGQKAFDKVYQNDPNGKKSSSLHCATLEKQPASQKRRRKAPGNWWEANPTEEEQEEALSEPQQQKPKELKTTEMKKKQPKKSVMSSSKPLEGAVRQKKRSLAPTRKRCSFMEESPPEKEKPASKKHSNVTTSATEDVQETHNVLSIQMDQLPEVQEQSPGRDGEQDLLQESISKVIASGPSSFNRLENEEEEDDVAPPALCASDLCSAPLRPLTLLPKDKDNLQVWLKHLWPAADKNPEITPDDFKWFCHRGRAVGVMADLQTGSVCNGKMLLGSFMKKPLWVDHSATTMFNLLTSSVCVVVDCDKSQYRAGQSFMVPPGHAYSITNLSAQPAVLYFTRFFTEEPDEY